MNGNRDRTSLLNYYSSQTQTHTIQLLTVALIGLGFLQVFPVSSLRKCIPDLLAFSLVISILVTLALRTTFRIFYWGYLSNAIIRDPEVAKKEEEVLRKQTQDALSVLQATAVSSVRSTHGNIAEYAQTGWPLWLLVTIAIWILLSALFVLLLVI
jgi:hypothetical protein